MTRLFVIQCNCHFAFTVRFTWVGVEFYEMSRCGSFLKASGMQQDWVRGGSWAPVMALLYGNLQALGNWHVKTLKDFEEINLASSRDYSSDIYEVVDHQTCALLIDLNYMSLGLFSDEHVCTYAHYDRHGRRSVPASSEHWIHMGRSWF